MKSGSGAGAVSLLDQGLASATTFVVSVVLARWLEPGEYGAFAIGFAVCVFLSRFHQALVLEPMSVFARRSQKHRMKEYIATVLRLHWIVAGALGAVLLVTGATPGLPIAGRGLALVVGFTLPLVLLQWTLRRLAYVWGVPGEALAGTAVYGLVLGVSLVVAHVFGRISIGIVCLLMAGAALASILVVCRRSGNPLIWLGGSAGGWREAARLHWTYGKWAAGFSLVDSLADPIYLPLLAVVAGLERAAAFRAIENLLQPVQIALSALSLFGLPILAERLGPGGRPFLASAGKLVPVALLVLCGGYLIVLATTAPWLIGVIYQRPLYREAAPLVPVLAVALMIRVLGDGGWGLLLRAAARPQVLFWGAAAGAAVSLLAGVPGVLLWTSSGAAWARVASATCFTGVVFAGFLRLLSSRPVGVENASCNHPA